MNYLYSCIWTFIRFNARHQPFPMRIENKLKSLPLQSHYENFLTLLEPSQVLTCRVSQLYRYYLTARQLYLLFENLIEEQILINNSKVINQEKNMQKSLNLLNKKRMMKEVCKFLEEILNVLSGSFESEEVKAQFLKLATSKNLFYRIILSSLLNDYDDKFFEPEMIRSRRPSNDSNSGLVIPNDLVNPVSQPVFCMHGCQMKPAPALSQNIGNDNNILQSINPSILSSSAIISPAETFNFSDSQDFIQTVGMNSDLVNAARQGGVGVLGGGTSAGQISIHSTQSVQNSNTGLGYQTQINSLPNSVAPIHINNSDYNYELTHAHSTSKSNQQQIHPPPIDLGTEINSMLNLSQIRQNYQVEANTWSQEDTLKLREHWDRFMEAKTNALDMSSDEDNSTQSVGLIDEFCKNSEELFGKSSDVIRKQLESILDDEDDSCEID